MLRLIAGPDRACHPEPDGRYTLKLALFVPVAQYILEQGVTIPVEVTRLLKSCVSLRLKASRQFAAASDTNDDSHRYFIDVLIKIRDLFEQAITKSIASPPSDASAEANAVPSAKANAVPEPLSNKFAALAVDDFEEDAEDVPDIQLPGVASSPDTTSFEPEMSLGEAVNAVVIFLDDMERTREYIIALWRDYKLEKVDLITAAVTTNTALELMKKPHDDFVQRVMPVFNHDFQKMVWLTFIALRGLSTGNPNWDMPSYNEVNSRDIKLARVYDFLMIPFISTLNGFTDLIHDNTVPVCRAGHWGIYDPTANFGKMPFLERWEQYQILLAESFTDMYFLLGLGDPRQQLPNPLPISGSPQGANMFFVDETLVMTDKFIKTKEVSFRFAFAMRVLIDINFTLGPAANRGRQLLNNTAENMVKCLKSRSSVEGSDPPRNWDSHNEVIIDRFIVEAKWFAEFDLRQLKRWPGCGNANWLLLERDPLLCGLLVFRLQMEYQDIGFKLSNTWASIMYAAHLYEACRHSGSLPGEPLPEWQDIELVLDIHGKEQAFGGKIPKTIDESNSAYQLVAGFSTDAVGANRAVFTDTASRYRAPRNPELMAKSGFRHFQNQTKIIPMFRRKFTVDVTTGVQYDIESIEGLLRDIKAGEIKDLAASVKKSERKGFRKERNHRGSKFSLTQLLSVLEKGLQVETTSIRFDYISMHLRCLRLFRKVKAVSEVYLTGKIGPDFLEDDSQLPQITGWIFMFAALGLRQTEKVTGVKRDGGMSKSRLLMNAAMEIRQILDIKNAGREETIKIEKDRKR